MSTWNMGCGYGKWYIDMVDDGHLPYRHGHPGY